MSIDGLTGKICARALKFSQLTAIIMGKDIVVKVRGWLTVFNYCISSYNGGN